MITYATILGIEPEHYYYVLKNHDKENICIMRAEEKEQCKYLLDKFDFKLTKGKNI